MARTPSNMLPLSTNAPEFTLPDTISGENMALMDLRGDQATVVMFICNHCPYVIRVMDGLLDVVSDYQKKGVSFVAISANDVENYPDDAPELMKKLAEERGFSFPYLYDESQEVAKAYDAACTPDFYVFDSTLKCAYRGQMDDARPHNEEPNDGKDLRAALDALLNGQPVSTDQKPSLGCNIKWKQ